LARFSVVAVFIGQERLGKDKRDLIAMDSAFIVIGTDLVTCPRQEGEVASTRC
jgi:hypothetical protein